MIVAIVNQKGGVGKTTVALGIAESAAHSGRKVLVCDLDPQANASSGLGIVNANHTIDEVLVDNPSDIETVIVSSLWPQNGSPAPSVAPSSPALAAREPMLANDAIGAQDRLQVALRNSRFDFIVIDCPPSLGLLTVNALFAADQALIVTAPAAWAADGVEQMLRTCTRVSDRRNGMLRTAGILVNNMGRTRDANYWLDHLSNKYPDKQLPPIHARTAIAEASAQALPLRALQNRAGAREATIEFDNVYAAIGEG